MQEVVWTHANLSFSHLRKIDTTKHVHKLHPYKGKFIPQLAESFLTNFKKNDIILDPFVGSGTTLVQAQEMGIHAIGIDVANFSCLIGEVKLLNYDLDSLEKEITGIKNKLFAFENEQIKNFEEELIFTLNLFNGVFFTPHQNGAGLTHINRMDDEYLVDKEKEFKRFFERFVKKYQIILKQDNWFVKSVREEIDYAYSFIGNIKNIKNRKILSMILSRTMHSSRATTHSDQANLKELQLTSYYCSKHKKICKPIFSIKNMFAKYADDSLTRLKAFSQLRIAAEHTIIYADSRCVDIERELVRKNKRLFKLLTKNKIRGIFTSPPYVGQIDYHKQHEYAYDLFKLKRNDDLEIGSLTKGQSFEARKDYVEDISKVLLNCKKYLADDFDIFLVANDKYNLYPEIAKKSGMRIVNKSTRPVLNRTESNSPFSETIFHLKNADYN